MSEKTFRFAGPGAQDGLQLDTSVASSLSSLKEIVGNTLGVIEPARESLSKDPAFVQGLNPELGCPVANTSFNCDG